MSNFYIIGFMGAGKTTIGKRFASKIGYQFIDLDDYIEKKNKHSIDSIFRLVGEEGFRKVENKALLEVSLLKKTVISTGGGTPCFFDNITIINNTGTSIYLKYSSKFLHHRLTRAKKKRPLIEEKKDNLLNYIEEILNIRDPYYLRAHYILENTNLKVSDLLEILGLPN